MIFLTAMLGIFSLFTPDDLDYTGKNIIIVILLGILFIYIFLVAWRKSDLRKILNEYIRQNYFLSIQTLVPKGKNSLEKFMSIAVNVFPSIKKEIKESTDGEISWENTHDKKLPDEYKFDISLKTLDGKFLLKYFPNGVKFEDVEKLVKIGRKNYTEDEVLRFVCLAPKFDEMFFTDELNEKMEKLIPSKPKEYKTLLASGIVKEWIKVDLILERENGYSIIWID